MRARFKAGQQVIYNGGLFTVAVVYVDHFTLEYGLNEAGDGPVWLELPLTADIDTNLTPEKIAKAAWGLKL